MSFFPWFIYERVFRCLDCLCQVVPSCIWNISQLMLLCGDLLVFLIKASNMKDFSSCDSNLFSCSGLQHRRCNHGGTQALCSTAHTHTHRRTHVKTRSQVHTCIHLPLNTAALFADIVQWGMLVNTLFRLLFWGTWISLNFLQVWLHEVLGQTCRPNPSIRRGGDYKTQSINWSAAI